jgi:hypothetical protein
VAVAAVLVRQVILTAVVLVVTEQTLTLLGQPLHLRARVDFTLAAVAVAVAQVSVAVVTAAVVVEVMVE